MPKQNKQKYKIKAGDTVYYECADGTVYKTTAMIVDGQEIVTPDGGYLSKKGCLNPDDPKVKNAIEEQYY